ncbi:Lacal_2735 family protein [Bermanella marisrubri]|uniref:Lacal_2735 family protein n=1 Tax=Bermanella marisrubri TaxID=207949 RepID=Q1N3E2_9GAMM|nr:DUF6435 family protein [Bermanella marisrubri]EAT12649.1 hypothetical protein RED65_13232 [Oceanobacter sp. RED65] [Bermanella marisrubri]QIZ85226.1 Lacal_2735 family protein [Bermanella marisrubri]
MFGFLKKDPIKKLEKEYEMTLAKAMQYQRNGDIKTYSALSEKAQGIYEEIQKKKSQG